ncbi:MAG: GNAT family N-acetyltransferase [Anaerolineae bacterium]|nr:MAG: GNAT family N-acetyltransferase [Anaerolineae bacterium]
MPEIQVRPATSSDIAVLCALDAHYVTEAIWRMDPCAPNGAMFREIRLPRSVPVAYPRSLEALRDTWLRFDVLLVAVFAGEVLGFCSLYEYSPAMAWMQDLVVAPSWRRQGIGTALVLAGLHWAETRRCNRLTLEMQPRNIPAIRLAQKLGFVFAGYHEHFYASQEPALFFTHNL